MFIECDGELSWSETLTTMVSQELLTHANKHRNLLMKLLLIVHTEIPSWILSSIVWGVRKCCLKTNLFFTQEKISLSEFSSGEK